MATDREPLVQPVADAAVDADVLALFQTNTEKGYQDASFMRLLAHRPEILKAFVGVSKAFFFGRESTVEHRLKELIRLKIASINQCHY
jgi:alkylhydroperoxidase family enzyme